MIPVDAYGRCGQLKCGGKWNSKAGECQSMLRDYRFYLSLENAVCRDYLTEKLYKTFINDTHVLAVARGGADYSALLPRGTFIDADQFASPEDLGR